MGIIEIHFGHVWKNTALGPGTKLHHILCDGIGPLQLGVVLIIIYKIHVL